MKTLTFEELEARLGSAEIRRRKLSNAGRKGAAARVAYTTYDLCGGPLDGQKVSLAGPSSAVLCLRGRFGRYTAASELPTHEARAAAAQLDAAWREAKGRRWLEPAHQLHWQDL